MRQVFCTAGVTDSFVQPECGLWISPLVKTIWPCERPFLPAHSFSLDFLTHRCTTAEGQFAKTATRFLLSINVLIKSARQSK